MGKRKVVLFLHPPQWPNHFRMGIQSQLPQIYLNSILILLNSRFTLKTIQTRNWSSWTNSNWLENGEKFHNAFHQEKKRAHFVAASLFTLPQVWLEQYPGKLAMEIALL